MPRGTPNNKPRPITADLSNPFVLRAVIEMPLNRPDVYVRTTLERRAEGYTPGTELWEAYRLWAHREPMSESSFLAALEKAKHAISYGDDHEWFLDGWCYPGTAPVKVDAKPCDTIREKHTERGYVFTAETLSLEKIKAVALLCTTFNGIAESIGWPAKKFAIYRARFPRVEKAIEQVWRENPDRFKEPERDAIDPNKRRGMAKGGIAAALARRKG